MTDKVVKVGIKVSFSHWLPRCRLQFSLACGFVINSLTHAHAEAAQWKLWLVKA